MQLDGAFIRVTEIIASSKYETWIKIGQVLSVSRALEDPDGTEVAFLDASSITVQETPAEIMGSLQDALFAK